MRFNLSMYSFIPGSREFYTSCLFTQVNLLLTSLEKMNIAVEDKELAKMVKMADKNKKIQK